MSSSRIASLQALLARVQERKASPRLRAVPAPEPVAAPPAPAPAPFEPPVVAAAPRPAPEWAPASAPVTVPAPLAREASIPPVSEAPRKAPSSSPLETAMAQLDDSGPLQVEALAEPIAPSRSISFEPTLQAQEAVVTHRPGEDSGEIDVPIELTQPAKKTVEREPTIEFETAKVRVSARELKAVGEPAPSAEPQAAAPSQTLEAPALPAAARPVQVVSAARIEAPKTFGELLERSLALRPKA